MNVEFLLQLCAQHGIRLMVSGDGSDRLVVDAPKGSLTPALREALAANKSLLITALKNQTLIESDSVTLTPSNPPQNIAPLSHYDLDNSNLPAFTGGVGSYSGSVAEALVGQEARLRFEEERLRQAAIDLERRRLE